MADSANNIFGRKLIDDENHVSHIAHRAVLSEFTEKKTSFDFPFNPPSRRNPFPYPPEKSAPGALQQQRNVSLKKRLFYVEECLSGFGCGR